MSKASQLLDTCNEEANLGFIKRMDKVIIPAIQKAKKAMSEIERFGSDEYGEEFDRKAMVIMQDMDHLIKIAKKSRTDAKGNK